MAALTVRMENADFSDHTAAIAREIQAAMDGVVLGTALPRRLLEAEQAKPKLLNPAGRAHLMRMLCDPRLDGDRHCKHGFTNCNPCGYRNGRMYAPLAEEWVCDHCEKRCARKPGDWCQVCADEIEADGLEALSELDAKPPCRCGGTGRVWGAIGGTWPCREPGCEAGAMEAGAKQEPKSNYPVCPCCGGEAVEHGLSCGMCDVVTDPQPIDPALVNWAHVHSVEVRAPRRIVVPERDWHGNVPRGQLRWLNMLDDGSCQLWLDREPTVHTSAIYDADTGELVWERGDEKRRPAQFCSIHGREHDGTCPSCPPKPVAHTDVDWQAVRGGKAQAPEVLLLPERDVEGLELNSMSYVDVRGSGRKKYFMAQCEGDDSFPTGTDIARYRIDHKAGVGRLERAVGR